MCQVPAEVMLFYRRKIRGSGWAQESASRSSGTIATHQHGFSALAVHSGPAEKAHDVLLGHPSVPTVMLATLIMYKGVESSLAAGAHV